MSSSNTVFNNNSFVENLNLTLGKNVLSGVNGDPAGINGLISVAFIKNIAGPAYSFFNSVDTVTNPLTTVQTLVQNWNLDTGRSASDQTLYNDLLQDFKNQIGYPQDWQALIDNGTVSDATINQYFVNSFNNFLSTYPYVSRSDYTTPAASGTEGVLGNPAFGSQSADNFFTNWANYMARTADISAISSSNTPVPLAQYQTVYEAFFPQQPGETAQDVTNRFYAALQLFINSQTVTSGSQNSANGWFIPSQSFSAWFQQLKDQFVSNTSKTAVQLQTTVSSGTAVSLLVLDRILRLLIDATNTLQLISASQAGQLNFETQWTQAYTNMLTQVPQFAIGGIGSSGGPLAQKSNAATAFRNKEVNPKMQSILENVQALRGSVQDLAKSTQTTITQSQDASNQLTQMATSLLQQLSTIISQIFK